VDGAAVKCPGQFTYQRCRKLLDEVVLVPECRKGNKKPRLNPAGAFAYGKEGRNYSTLSGRVRLTPSTVRRQV